LGHGDSRDYKYPRLLSSLSNKYCSSFSSGKGFSMAIMSDDKKDKNQSLMAWGSGASEIFCSAIGKKQKLVFPIPIRTSLNTEKIIQIACGSK